jgi:hypothetical protein
MANLDMVAYSFRYLFVKKLYLVLATVLAVKGSYITGAYCFYNGEETWIDSGQKNIDHRSTFPGRRPSVTTALTFS